MWEVSDECLWVSNHLVVFLRSIVTLPQCQDTFHGIWRVLTRSFLEAVTGFWPNNPVPNQSSICWHSFWNGPRAGLLLAYKEH